MEYKINNEPEYARNYEFVVARNVDGEFWFYGAYSDGFKAEQAAIEMGGLIFHNVRIQGIRKESDGSKSEA